MRKAWIVIQLGWAYIVLWFLKFQLFLRGGSWRARKSRTLLAHALAIAKKLSLGTSLAMKCATCIQTRCTYVGSNTSQRNAERSRDEERSVETVIALVP